ncbi:hypothetical protein GCM10027063_04720 [Promicromonospora xylanilytica]
MARTGVSRPASAVRHSSKHTRRYHDGQAGPRTEDGAPLPQDLHSGSSSAPCTGTVHRRRAPARAPAPHAVRQGVTDRNARAKSGASVGAYTSEMWLGSA